MSSQNNRASNSSWGGDRIAERAEHAPILGALLPNRVTFIEPESSLAPSGFVNREDAGR
ncbi:hypothetical protein [Burkholderia sola]